MEVPDRNGKLEPVEAVARPTAARERDAEPRTVDVQRFQIDGEELAVLAISSADSACLDALTSAEREVCGLVLRGLSNAEIAETRGTSPNTVKNQIASSFRKLGIDSRAELAASWR